MPRKPFFVFFVFPRLRGGWGGVGSRCFFLNPGPGFPVKPGKYQMPTAANFSDDEAISEISNNEMINRKRNESEWRRQEAANGHKPKEKRKN